MEKTLTPDERIRRAEEIYYRKKIQASDRKSARVNVSDKRKSVLLQRMILQIIICIVIYIILYMIQNTNYIFSEDVIYQINKILNYDINFTKLYEQGKNYINNFIYEIPETENNDNNDVQDNNVQNEENQEIVQDDAVENLEENQETSEAIGGESVEIEEANSMSEMEQDATNVLKELSLISPLKGTITSRFGNRESNNPIVSKYHTGIDIAVNQGTVFVSAMSGTVQTVSSEGEYGNHIEIVSGDVMTLYAHCKTIYVSEGDQIFQGQQLGEVGSTGNATGPHLHFEIRKENRYIDPDLILQF